MNTKETAEFVEFWEKIWRANMRNTDGRRLARDAFFKHVAQGTDPQDIVDGARFFLRNMKDKEREFIPLSATWLNRGTYEDLAPKEREYQQRIAERAAQASKAPTNVQQLRPAGYKTPFQIQWEKQQAGA